MTTDQRNQNIRAVLLEARQKIARPFGWTQGRPFCRRWFLPYESYCLLGAIYSSSGPYHCLFPAIDVVREQIMKHESPPNSTVAVFNDAPDRTKADILRVLDRAIADLAPHP